TTRLPYEIASADTSTGAIQLYYKQSLSHAADTLAYISFGNSSVVAYQGDDLNAWNSNFSAVYHLEQNTLSGGNITQTADSTSNAITLKNTGTGTPPSGIAGKAAGFASSFLDLNATPAAGL